MRKAAQEAAQEAITSLQNELRGRALSIMGYLLGERSISADELEPINKEDLEEAISLCEQGYSLLRKVGEGPAAYMALNNLIFYSCVGGEESRRRFLLEKAVDLRRAGQEHGAPKLLLTACRVILQLGSDEREKEEAHKILRSLAGKTQISEKERKEANHYIRKILRGEWGGRGGIS